MRIFGLSKISQKRQTFRGSSFLQNIAKVSELQPCGVLAKNITKWCHGHHKFVKLCTQGNLAFNASLFQISSMSYHGEFSSVFISVYAKYADMRIQSVFNYEGKH